MNLWFLKSSIVVLNSFNKNIQSEYVHKPGTSENLYNPSSLGFERGIRWNGFDSDRYLKRLLQQSDEIHLLANFRITSNYFDDL